MRYQSSIVVGLRRAGLAVIPAVICAVAACGPFRRGSAGPPAILFFTNESLDAADLFAVTPAGQRVRLGTVFAGRTDTLEVPRDIVAAAQNVNLVARVLARSVVPQSGPLAIHPGDTLQVRLPIDLKVLVVLPAQQ